MNDLGRLHVSFGLPRGVRPRGASYAVDVSVGGKRRTRTAATIEEALFLQRQLRSELRGEPVVLPPVAPPSWTIKKAIDVAEKVAWKETAWGKHALHNARKFQRHVGADAPLDTIDTNTLDQWVADLKVAGKSDGTINRHLAAVSKAMSIAQERGGLVSRPKFPRRKENQGRIRYLREAEEQTALRLLQQWGKLAERDLFIILIDTGLRVGEALRLEARDVVFNTGIVTVWKTKNDLPRSVPMTKRVREVLNRATNERPAGPVVAASRHSFRQAWDRARAAMKLTSDPQFVPHALRHTCASRLVQRGVALKVVQEWMGHKSIGVTMRYAHLAPANLLEAVRVLEE